MKFVLFLTIYIGGAIFATQTASIYDQDDDDEINNTIGDEENTRDRIENEITEIQEIASIRNDNIIECESIHQVTSLDDLQSENFETEYAPSEIKVDQQLPEQVLEILRYPSKTPPEQLKTELQHLLTDDQYDKIRIKAQSPSIILSQDSNDDPDTVQNIAAYTSDTLPIEFPTNDDDDDSDRTIILTKPLESTDRQSVVQHFVHEIHSRKDPDISETTTIDDNPIPVNIEKNLADFVARYVANELTDIVMKPQSKNSASESNPTIQSDNQTNIPIHAVDYTIANINKSTIDGLREPFDQTWQGPDYQVRLKRNSPQGDTELWWKKANDDIYIHTFANGAVDQNWGFGTVHLGIFRDEHGNQIQMWNFGQTRLEYIKNVNNPTPQRIWEFGNSDEASYWKYRHFIKLWCEANDFFVDAESCVIF